MSKYLDLSSYVEQLGQDIARDMSNKSVIGRSDGHNPIFPGSTTPLAGAKTTKWGSTNPTTLNTNTWGVYKKAEPRTRG